MHSTMIVCISGCLLSIFSQSFQYFHSPFNIFTVLSIFSCSSRSHFWSPWERYCSGPPTSRSMSHSHSSKRRTESRSHKHRSKLSSSRRSRTQSPPRRRSRSRSPRHSSRNRHQSRPYSPRSRRHRYCIHFSKLDNP